MSLSRVRWCAVLLFVLASAQAAPPTTRPVQGLRENTPNVHALTNARIVVSPGRVLEKGNVVLRDGSIEAVGDVKPPADARVWDLDGKTIYAGLIDAFSEMSVDTAKVTAGSPYWNNMITPQLNVADQYKSDSELNKKLREQGIGARLVAPSGRILKGTSAVVLTSDDPNRETIVEREVAQHLRLTVPRGRGRDNYPNSPMGAVALARQAMYDTDWYHKAWAAYRADSSLQQPERNDALAALRDYARGSKLIIADASNELFVLRADRYAREFSLNIVIRGSGHEYKQLDAIKATGRPVLLPVDFPKPPNVASAESARNVNLSELMHWDIARENAARLEQAGIKIAFTSYDLDDKETFLAGVRKAVARGLPADAALRAMTMTPATLYGVEDELGSIEANKIANLVVTDGELFDEKTKVLETWVNGKRYEVVSKPLVDLPGKWKFTIGDDSPPLLMTLEGKPDKLTGSISAEQDDGKTKEVKLSRVGLRDARFSCTFNASDLCGEGVARLTAVVSIAGTKSKKTPTSPQASPKGRGGQARGMLGHVTLADGKRIAFSASKVKDAERKVDEETSEQEDTEGEEKDPAASFAVNYPLGAFGRSEAPKQPRAIVFKNATVWTSGKAGTIDGASVLVVRGKIRAVGKAIKAPANAIVVDATGKHITPGIIDCHSHFATDGGVNESTQAITAEVRIGDFIDTDDIEIYRQLAGGVTSSNILHGSANPIGGQNQVVKLRWGSLPEQMKFAEAPQGIKFALGENVKQSNWGDEYTTRYPQTRMGVEQIMRDAFHAAKQYRKDWNDWKWNRQGLPPRKDLEMEAIAEIVEGSRWIHCHSYRQDEILALIRTLDDFDITIGSFQHILEGYKVADAMAIHGATGSAFSDWWAYKFEVYDAIPYAGALMHNAGVVVSFNSDDRELARHLNQEAAKAMKYGGVPAAEALKFVTLNPAKQLRIEKYVGSLEKGKHADLVIWSGSPLSNFSRCEQTWIDGRKYFDLNDDRKARAEEAKIRNALIQKILDSDEEMESDDEKKKEDSELWPRDDIFCHRHGHG